MWLVFAVGALVLSIYILGTFVLLRGAKSRVDFTFALFAYAAASWIAFNFLGANFKDQDFSVYATRLDFLTGCALVYLIWAFSASLLMQADTHKTRKIWYGMQIKVTALLLAAIPAIATLIPSVLNVEKPPLGDLEVVYGDYFIVYAAGLVLILCGVVVNFVNTARLATGRLRQQVSMVLTALAVSVIFVGFVNLLLPQLSKSAGINLVAGNLSYLGLAFFVAATIYSIVRHRLFDLRLVLARSAAYALLIVLLTSGYGALALLLSSTLIEDFEFSGSQAVVPIIALVFLAFTITPLLGYFKRATNRLFYKDSYEPQQIIGDLSDVIIANVRMENLLTRVAEVMERYLKASFVLFDIHNNRRYSHMVTGEKYELNQTDLENLRNHLRTQKGPIIVMDELSADQKTLRTRLESLRISIAVRLSLLHGQEGYMFLGYKKNGSAYTSQDINVISIAAGELAIAIQNALRFQEIENFNKTLQEKIDEATRQLRRKNERLRLLDRTKDDFISMASHQLRTPLTSVKGYTSMVLEGDAGKVNSLQRKLLNQSFVSAQRMVYLISDLLNVSRLRTGKFELELVPTNLATVIISEVEQLKETAASRNLELTYTKPEHFPTYMLDETKMRQVIMNFIDNAIYYTPSGGKIEVTLLDKPESIELTVTDTGIGVPKRDQPHMFTKYFRAQNAQIARPDGTGLGLFMAKKVVIAHGGAVLFKSHENKGSTFGFSLAKRVLASPPAKSVK